MFGLSGSRSESRSTGRSSSSSFSFGSSQSRQGSISGGVSGGRSVAGSEDRASSRAQSGQQVAFEDVFARLFGGAEDVAANLDTSLLTQASNQLYSGGTEFLAGLGGDAGTDYLTQRLAGGDGVLQGQLDLLQSDIGELFREELLPGITSEAVGRGQLGGGRQGVAQGQAAEAAAEAFTQGATELRTRDQAQRDAIAGGVADRAISGAQIGLAGLPGLLQIAEGGMTAQTAPLQFLASILGDQTVLTESTSQSESQGQSFSNAMDFARQFAESFGFSSSQDVARSRSQSRTDSVSSSGSFGIGF